MNVSTHAVEVNPVEIIESKKVNNFAFLNWLAFGIKTFKTIPIQATIFGSIFALLGFLITTSITSQPQLVFAFWSGFLLIAPLFATVLYKMAALVSKNGAPSFKSCGLLFFNNVSNVFFMSLIMGLIMVAWIRISSLVFVVYTMNVSSGLSAAVNFSNLSFWFGTVEGFGLFLSLTLTSLIFFSLTFVLSAWSLPMLSERKVSFSTALVSSFIACKKNFAPMFLWSLSILCLSLFGMLTYFVSFIIVFPILGFATWHGYKELFS